MKLIFFKQPFPETPPTVAPSTLPTRLNLHIEKAEDCGLSIYHIELSPVEFLELMREFPSIITYRGYPISIKGE